jgi:superfamily II DNA or RNA helicase
VLYSIDRERQFVQRRGRILRQPKGVKKIADIQDVIILPHGTVMDKMQAERLLRKELRRYEVFSDLALNVGAATKTIQDALATATTR